MKTRTHKLFLILLISIFSSPLYSQGIQDTLLLSTIINTDEAQKKNYRDLGDLLSTLPGLWVRDTGATGQWSSCRIWGSRQNQVTLLLDGRPLIDPWSGIHDLNLIPVEMIEKIEIFPNLNPFGLFPIGGVVNIVSKKLQTKRPFTKILYRSGKSNFSDLDITFGQRITPRWEVLSGVLLKKYGENLPDRAYKGQKIRSKITWRPSSDWELKYTILYNKSETSLPYTLPVTRDTLLLTSPHFKFNRYDHTLQAALNLWGIETLLRIDHTSLNNEIREKNFNPLNVFPIQTTALFLKQYFQIGNIPLSWGINTRQRQLKAPDNPEYKDTITQGFIKGEIFLKKNLKTMAQVHVHGSPGRILRFLGSSQLSWNPAPPITLWISDSDGIRDPSLGERFGYPFFSIVPETFDQYFTQKISHQLCANLSLKPETSHTLETGIRWNLGKNFQTSFRAYYRTIQDLIQTPITEGTTFFTNQGKILIKGMETQLHFGPWYGLRASLILNLIKATDEEGENLLERPNLWGNGSISWERTFFQEDLSFEIFLGSRYWTDSWGLVGETFEDASMIYLNPSVLLDFKASFTFVKQAVFTFAVDNLLNTEKSLIAGFPLLGRTTRIGFSWELYD